MKGELVSDIDGVETNDSVVGVCRKCGLQFTGSVKTLKVSELCHQDVVDIIGTSTPEDHVIEIHSLTGEHP